MSPDASSDHNVPLYRVLAGGAELNPDDAARVREIKIQSYLRLPDMCTLTIVYPAAKPGAEQAVDGHPFSISSPLEVKMGSAEDTTTTSLFKGEVVSLEVKFGAGGVELVVRGFDGSHKLIRGRKSKTFQEVTASDAVTQVLQDAGFTPDVDAAPYTHEFLQQNNETDWDFIWRLAERIGFEFVVEDKTAHFRKPVGDNPVKLEWPTTLQEFSPRVTATQQATTVTVGGFDVDSKKGVMGSATSPNQIAKIGLERGVIAQAFGDTPFHVSSEALPKGDTGDTLAQALLDKLANGYIAAEGRCFGNPDIKAGVAVEVSGVGKTFSGTYRVAAATHVLRGGSTYETIFANSASHTLLGAVGADRGGAGPTIGSQLTVGLVSSNQDPNNQGRVRVIYPQLGSDNVEGAWARVATPSAGNARGMMMVPQPGEEVVVGFLHDDTAQPYVLGSLFNGSDTPGDDLEQSQDGSFAVLSDKKIVATAKDEMKLTATEKLTVTGSDDIEVNGSKDYNLTAQNNIKLDASQQDITISADMGNVKIQGAQQVSIQGNSQVSISCGGSSITMTSGSISISAPSVSIGA